MKAPTTTRGGTNGENGGYGGRALQYELRGDVGRVNV
jgi:hypothetical protein